jgi:hypothetical protein
VLIMSFSHRSSSPLSALVVLLAFVLLIGGGGYLLLVPSRTASPSDWGPTAGRTSTAAAPSSSGWGTSRRDGAGRQHSRERGYWGESRTRRERSNSAPLSRPTPGTGATQPSPSVPFSGGKWTGATPSPGGHAGGSPGAKAGGGGATAGAGASGGAAPRIDLPSAPTGAEQSGHGSSPRSLQGTGAVQPSGSVPFSGGEWEGATPSLSGSAGGGGSVGGGRSAGVEASGGVELGGDLPSGPSGSVGAARGGGGAAPSGKSGRIGWISEAREVARTGHKVIGEVDRIYRSKSNDAGEASSKGEKTPATAKSDPGTPGDPTQEVPIGGGGGMALLAAAGGAYAVRRLSEEDSGDAPSE